MFAIMRRELNSYFSSAIGYIFLAVFFLFSGYYFFFANVIYGTADMTNTFSSLFSISLFITPVLTMRLMSEDKKLKTDQLLLTAPVSLPGLVMGKLLAAVIIFGIGVLSTLLQAFAIGLFVTPDWAIIISNIVGLLCMGIAVISVGMFISSLTENQVIAAIGGLAAMILLQSIDMLASLIPVDFLSRFVAGCSFYTRYTDFTIGVLNFSNIVFFISFAGIFVYLTIRVLEKRRWS